MESTSKSQVTLVSRHDDVYWLPFPHTNSEERVSEQRNVVLGVWCRGAKLMTFSIV